MDHSFIFVGNRFFVLEEMLRLNLHIKKIFAIQNSYLEKELSQRNIQFTSITSKKQLIDEIQTNDFDFFVSNGCPYILPISELQTQKKKFINVHPSYLPDLRGGDPQPGALLFAKDSGATCHVMDDGIDTGGIIAQVKIPYSQDLDVALLYQLTFLAEKEVFILAYKNNFVQSLDQQTTGLEIYYSKKEQDLKIDFYSPINEIYQKIKAFSNRSQGSYFIFDNTKYKVYDCEIVKNTYLISKSPNYQDSEVVFNYENILLIKKDDAYLKLKNFSSDVGVITPGSVLKDVCQ